MIGRSSMSAFIISAVAIGLAGPSLAQEPGAEPGCRIVVESGSSQWIINYDPFVDVAAERVFDVAVLNQGGGACAGVVGLDLRGESFGLSQNGAGDRLAYAVIDERGSADITPRSGRNSRSIGSRPLMLEPGERSVLRFSVVVDPASLPNAGLYTQTAFLTLNQTDGVPLVERPVTLGVRVPTAAMMGLKGEFQRRGHTATIDLGPLSEANRPLNTSLYVLSTGGYSISVSSTNRGQLRQGMTDWYVPYTISVGDTTINLTSPRPLNVPSDGSRSDDYPLAINVGSVSGRRAGDYTDTVTFTVSAL